MMVADTKPRHILILNWRDMAHPQAGGAEKVTQEIARRWVSWGHRVTLFCASFPRAPQAELVDGVQIVRSGRQHTVHWEAFRYYRQRSRDRYDLIIDEVNTIPFFAPLYAQEPVVMFSHQLAREVWRFEAPFPISMAGYIAEPLYLQAYRHTPIMTVSQSTRDDLYRLGLRGPFRIIPEAVDIKAPEQLPPVETKETHLTLAFAGRVVPSKRVDHIIRALALIHHAGYTQAQLWIIGAWDERYRRRLERQIAELGLGNYVTFYGFVSAKTKEELLAHAHLCVMTSVREGWGLVVTEANMVGTPAVVYDVPGLRDSTLDGETGLVCRRNTPHDLSQAILSLQKNHVLYSRLRHRAWSTARQLNWDQTAREAWQAVEEWL